MCVSETIRTVRNHKNCIDQDTYMTFYTANAKFWEEKNKTKILILDLYLIKYWCNHLFYFILHS